MEDAESKEQQHGPASAVQNAGSFGASAEADGALLTSVLDAIPDPIFVKDKDHRWIAFNDAFCTFMGRTRAELHLKSDYDFLPKQQADVFWAKDELVFRTETTNENEEELTDAAGVTRVVSTKKAVARGVDGSKVLVGIIRDVTERRRLQTQVVLGDRLASVGTLAAGVAHELNGPLAYVLSNLELAGEALRDVASSMQSPIVRELVDAVADARDGAERMRRIVRELRIFARARDERREIVSLRRVIEVATNMTMNELRHRATLVTNYGPAPEIVADESRLAQVFINLLVNAAQSIPDGHADRNEIRVTLSTDVEGRAVAEVSDTGCGIPRDAQSRIWDPFFTTKPIGVGPGLGLSICHEIVTSMGGTIGVESEPGKGSTFRVVLPASQKGTLAPPSGVVDTSAGSARRGRVLVIDDDPKVGIALKRTLSRDHDVVLAVSGDEALRIVREGATFDVVLCDVMMPVMNGMDVYAAFEAMAPALADAIVFMTGGAFSQAAREFLASVRNTKVEKPFDVPAIRALVKERVRRR